MQVYASIGFHHWDRRRRTRKEQAHLTVLLISTWSAQLIEQRVISLVHQFSIYTLSECPMHCNSFLYADKHELHFNELCIEEVCLLTNCLIWVIITRCTHITKLWVNLQFSFILYGCAIISWGEGIIMVLCTFGEPWSIFSVLCENVYTYHTMTFQCPDYTRCHTAWNM